MTERESVTSDKANDKRSEPSMDRKDESTIHALPHAVEPIPDPTVDFVEQFIHIVPALWRTMKRAAISARDLPANESQVTILRLVIHHSRLTPAQLADIMHLARPTISNLLKGLVSEGLVERLVSQRDARVMSVVATEKGRELLGRFRVDRADVVRDGFESLGETERQQLIEAAPALRLLLRELELRAEEAEQATGHEFNRIEEVR